MAHRRYARLHTQRVRHLVRTFRQRWLRTLLVAGGGLLLIGAATILWWSRDLPDPDNLNSRQVHESTKIYDSSGQHILYEIGDIHRTVVPLSSMSRFIRQATLAAEDDQFYEHHGLDFFGIVRGVVLKPLSGQRAQGGSTITQQLIKNSILTPERTLRRKVKEAVLAIELEQRFTKDEILAMYLNQIPYGSQAYGVQTAAQSFFGKSAADLTLAEAATLASLPRAPSYYSPYGSHFEDLKRRQEHILKRMADLNMISAEQADSAIREKLTFSPRRESIQAPHFVFYVRELLDAEYGERVVEEGGLKIITTLDIEKQTIAEEVMKERQATLTKQGASNAALTAIDPKTGDILAMVGSVDYFNEEIDGNVNVAIRHRSPGSSIKPFIYAAAFGRGYTPETILVDAETDFGQGYKPRNYNLSEHGPVSMRTALAGSLNIPAVKTLYLVGVREATDLAQKMGIASLNDPDRYGLSLVLGGGEVRLLDEVSAYGVFANEGVRRPHRAILKVERDGETVFDANADEQPGEQVLDPQVARQITNILSDNNARALTFGAGSPLQLGSRPVAAKTGTAQEFRDGWTVGYTPSLVAGVWAGNNDNTPMGRTSDGVVVAAPIWNAFMRRALANKPIETFVQPSPSGSLPHAVLRGELPEVKGKWDREGGTIYTNECPVAVGQPKTFKELHDILYYIRRSDPRGAPPATAENDPQFSRWEAGVAAWRDKHNEKTKDDPAEPHYVATLPEPTCGIENASDLPKVEITEPSDIVLRTSPVRVVARVDSTRPLKEIRFLVDSKEIARKNPDEPLEAEFSFPSSWSGRKTLVVQAITEDKLIGRASRTFVINPDDSAPSVTLHTPTDGLRLKPTDFPYKAKVTAQDKSGIEFVDILYRKDGTPGIHRISRITAQAPSPPNRYEAQWPDSPGPGTYHVYAVAYDKTGNTTQSPEHTVTIE